MNFIKFLELSHVPRDSRDKRGQEGTRGDKRGHVKNAEGRKRILEKLLLWVRGVLVSLL